MRRLRNDFVYYWPQQDLIILVSNMNVNDFTAYHGGFLTCGYIEFEQLVTLGPL